MLTKIAPLAPPRRTSYARAESPATPRPEMGDELFRLEVVGDIIRDVLDDPSLSIGPETTADQTEGWDSFNHINIVVAIEQKFGIKFKTAEIESLRNVGDLLALIKKRKS